MLLIGKHITYPADPLQPVEERKVYKAIRNPRSEVVTLLNRLHAIRMVDEEQYRKMKTNLPYMVCANFHPKVRRKENFIYTERFMVDIDHLSVYGLNPPILKDKLRNDNTIELMFTSPGGDGLKILFVLEEKITDAGYYSFFYRTFCNKFALKYHLEGAIDTKTSDVSRCCFVSHDPEAYFNPACQKIDAAAYLSPDDLLQQQAVERELRKQEKMAEEKRKEANIPEKDRETLSEEILIRIKERVGVRVKKRPPKVYEQPEELKDLMIKVRELVSEVGAEVIDDVPISYGRKIRIGAGKHWAEVNLFYGQRGVSIVGTSKSGSNKELTNILAALLKDYFQNN